MQIRPIRTRRLQPPQDSFFEALCESLPVLSEKNIIALSSKAVAIGEGRCVLLPENEDVQVYKDRLAEAEAEYFLPRGATGGGHPTIIHGSLMWSAGIDESNGDGHFVLWPRDPMYAAQEYRTKLQKRYGVEDLAVIIVDSHSMPLHNGALGTAIGYAGFLPIKDYRGSLDLFGRAFKFERLNIADSLAVAATCVMGEGDELTPAVVIEDMPHITFTDEVPNDPYLQLTIPKEEDYFRVFINNVEWKKGGGGYHMS